MRERIYCVYILTNQSHRVLYTGISGDLPARVRQHKEGTGGIFTRKYRVDKLVYYEEFTDVEAAILREKQIKAGTRQRKLDLINGMNPDWRDLAEDFG